MQKELHNVSLTNICVKEYSYSYCLGIFFSIKVGFNYQRLSFYRKKSNHCWYYL